MAGVSKKRAPKAEDGRAKFKRAPKAEEKRTPIDAFDGDWDSDGVKLTVKGLRLTFPSGKVLKFEAIDSRTCFLTISGERLMGKLQKDRKTLKWSDGDVWYRIKDVQSDDICAFEGDWNLHGERYVVHGDTVTFPAGREFKIYDLRWQENGLCVLILDNEEEVEGVLESDGRRIRWDDGDIWKRGQPIGTRFKGEWMCGIKKVTVKRSLIQFESGSTWEDIRGTNAKTMAVLLGDEEHIAKIVDDDKKITWSDGDVWYRAMPLGRFEGEWVQRGVKVEITDSIVRFPSGSSLEFHPMSETTCVLVDEGKEVTGKLTAGFTEISWSKGNNWYKAENVSESFQGDWMKGDTLVSVNGCLVQFPSGPNWFIRDTDAKECMMVAPNDEPLTGSVKKDDRQIHWSDGTSWQRPAKVKPKLYDDGPKPVGARFEGVWRSGNKQAEIQGSSVIWESGKAVDIHGLDDMTCLLVTGKKQRKGKLVHGDQQIFWDDGDRWYREWENKEHTRREFVGHRFEGKWMSGEMQVRIDGSVVYFPSGVTLDIDGTSDSTCILVIDNEDHTGELVDGDQTILWSDGDKWHRVLMEDERQEVVSFRFQGEWTTGDMQVKIEGSSVFFPSGKVLDIDGTGATTCILVIDGEEHTGELVDDDHTIIWSDGDKWYRVLHEAEGDRRELVGPRFEGEWTSGDMQVKIEGSSVFFPSGKVLDIDGTGDTTCILVIGEEEHEGELVDGDQTIMWSDGDKWHRLLDEAESARRELVGPRFEGEWKTGDMQIKIQGSSVFFPSGKVLDIDGTGDTTCILVIGEEEHAGELTAGDRTIIWSDGDKWHRVLTEVDGDRREFVGPRFEGEWKSGGMQLKIEGSSVFFPSGKVLDIDGTGDKTCVLVIGQEEHAGELVNGDQTIIWSDGDKWHRVLKEAKGDRQDLVGPRFEGDWISGAMQVKIEGSSVFFPSGTVLDLDRVGDTICILVVDDEEHVGELVDGDRTIAWSGGDQWHRVMSEDLVESPGPKPVNPRFEGHWTSGDVHISIRGTEATFETGMVLQIEGISESTAVLLIGGEDQEGKLENSGQEIVWTGGDIWYRVAAKDEGHDMQVSHTSESCRQEFVNPRFEGRWNNGEMEVLIEGSVVIFPSGATLDIDGTGETTCILVIGDEEHTGDLVDGDQRIVWNDGDVWQRMSEEEIQKAAIFQGEWFVGQARIMVRGSTAILPSGKSLMFEASKGECNLTGRDGDDKGYTAAGKLLPDGKTIMWNDGDIWHRECASGSIGSDFDGDWLNEDVKIRIAGTKAVLLSSGHCLNFKPAGLSCSLFIRGEEHWGSCSPDGKTIFWDDGECWHRQARKLGPAAEEARQQYMQKVKRLYNQREGATLQIQAAGRRLLARKEVSKKRKLRAADEREMRLFKNEMAIKLQAAWRQKQAREEVQQRRLEAGKREKDRRRAEAATKIEAAEKGRQARKTLRDRQQRPASKVPTEPVSGAHPTTRKTRIDQGTEQSVAVGIAPGTVLACLYDEDGPAEIFESARSEVVIGTVPPGETVEARGAPLDVDGYMMLPIKPQGAVQLELFQIIGAEEKRNASSIELPVKGTDVAKEQDREKERQAEKEREEQERQLLMRQEQRKRERAASKIQFQFRGAQERQSRVEEEQKKRARAASKIQLEFRGHAREQEMKRVKVQEEMKRAKEQEEMKRAKAQEEMERAMAAKKHREEWDQQRKEMEAKRKQEEREREVLEEQERRKWAEQERRKQQGAAAKIQQEFRGYRKTVTERHARELEVRQQEESRHKRSFEEFQKKRAAAALILESKCRSFVKRLEFYKITAPARRALVLQRAKERKLQFLREEQERRLRALQERRLYDPEGFRRDEAATQIQATWRGGRGRQEANRKQRKKALQEEKEVIQRKLKEMSRHPRPRTRLEKEKDKAAARIQARFRGRTARTEMDARLKVLHAERQREDFYGEVTSINLEMDSMVRRLQLAFIDPADLELERQTLVEMPRRLAEQATKYMDTMSALGEAPLGRSAVMGQGSARRHASPKPVPPGAQLLYENTRTPLHLLHGNQAMEWQVPASAAGQLPSHAAHSSARAMGRLTAAGQLPQAGADDVIVALRGRRQAYTPPAGVQNRSQRPFGTLAAAGSCDAAGVRDRPSPGQGYMSGVGVKIGGSQGPHTRLEGSGASTADCATAGNCAAAGVTSKGTTPLPLPLGTTPLALPPRERRVHFSD